MANRLFVTLAVVIVGCGGDAQDPPNQGPVAAIAQPAADLGIDRGDTVDFTATCVDPEGDALTLRWDFDGAAPDADTAIRAVTFDEAGTFEVVFTCTDADGLAASARRTITVAAPPPPNVAPSGEIITPDADRVIETGASVSFEGACSDPEGSAVTHLWSFGGAAPDALVATTEVVFATAGVYVASYTCSDAAGLADATPATRRVEVVDPVPVNTAPVASITAPAADVEVIVGDAVRFVGACDDAEGDVVTHRWSFDGVAPESTLSAPDEVVFEALGSYEVTYTCTDAAGLASLPAAVLVDVVAPPNAAPVGTITSPSGDVEIFAGETVSFAASCVDPDGDTVQHHWDFDGAAGDRAIPAPGQVRFADVGPYVVTYTCTDAKGLAGAPVTVDVAVIERPNVPPVATITSPSGDVEIFMGETVAFAATCVDPDGDTVQHHWSFDGAAGDRAVSAPGQVRFADVGTYVVTYTCTDAQGLAGAPVAVTVEVVERPNVPPVATIIAPVGDVEIYAGDMLAFEGRCTDTDGATVTHLWDFGALGTSEEASVELTFEVPGTYRIAYGCSDDDGALAEVDVRDVTVMVVGPPVHAVSGVATFDKVPGRPDGLAYEDAEVLPIRGAEVWVIDATTEDVVAETMTDAQGRFAASWPVGGPDFVKVWILSRTAVPVIAVVDNTNNGSVYALESAVIDTSRGRVFSVHAASGWDGTRYASRSAAPYAVLDSAYEAATRVWAVRPGLVLPELTVNWSKDNAPTAKLAGETQEAAYAAGRIETSQWNGQALYILGLEDVNTDEYDDRIIVHEWAHYFDAKVIGRNDTPGGSHASGDTKDPRLAFSEGWATALAAMVWWPDTRFSNIYGAGQRVAYAYDLQDNGAEVNPGWFSERSVMSILLDVFDDGGPAEGHDAVALGLGAIIDVMVDDMQVTPAFLTLFAFIDALKRAHPAAAAAIDALGAHRGVLGVPVVDAFGMGETNDAGDPNNLPVYRSIDAGPVTAALVHSAVFNDLGQIRYFRFKGDGSEVRVRLDNDSTQDTDLWVYRAGVEVTNARSYESNELTAPFVAEAGVDYVVLVRGDPLTASCSITVSLERAP